jgi:hypothetical protein
MPIAPEIAAKGWKATAVAAALAALAKKDLRLRSVVRAEGKSSSVASVRSVPVFLGAGTEENARQKNNRDHRNNNKRGMKVHGADSLLLRLPNQQKHFVIAIDKSGCPRSRFWDLGSSLRMA